MVVGNAAISDNDVTFNAEVEVSSSVVSLQS